MQPCAVLWPLTGSWPARSSRRKSSRPIHSRVGEHGPLIRRVQERLREEGFYSGELRGVFDSSTLEAVKQFQRQHELGADGVLGEKTITWLNVPYEEKYRMIAHSLGAMRKSDGAIWIGM